MLSQLHNQTADRFCSNWSTHNTHISNKRRVFQSEMVVNRALSEKCRDGEVQQVKEALANGADPNSTDDGGVFSFQSTLLMIAVLKYRVEVVDLLLATDGIDVNIKRTDGRTALHLAIYSASWGMDTHPIIIKLLGAPGINVNALDNLNHTPIMVALKDGRTEAVRLLAPVANLDCKFPGGQSLEER